MASFSFLDEYTNQRKHFTLDQLEECEFIDLCNLINFVEKSRKMVDHNATLSKTSSEIIQEMSQFLLAVNKQDYHFGSKELVDDKFGTIDFQALSILRIDEEFHQRIKELNERLLDKDQQDEEDNEDAEEIKTNIDLEYRTFIEILIKKFIEMVYTLRLCGKLLDESISHTQENMNEKHIKKWENLLFSLLTAEEGILDFHGLFRSLISHINNDGKILGYDEFQLSEQVPGEVNYAKYVEINSRLRTEEYRTASKSKIQVDYLQYAYITPQTPDYEKFQWFSVYKGNCVEVISDLIFEIRSHALTKNGRASLNQVFHSLFYNKPISEKLIIGFLFRGKQLIWTVTPNDSFGDIKRNKVEQLIYCNQVNKEEQIPMLLNYIQLLKEEKIELEVLLKEKEKEK